MSKTERVLECVQRLQGIAEGIQGSAREDLDRELLLLRAIVDDRPLYKRAVPR